MIGLDRFSRITALLVLWTGCLTILFCLVKTGSCVASRTAPLQLKVLPAAVVHGQRVQLGEIARPLPGSDEQMWQEVCNKDLWLAPDRGKSERLSRAKVRELLQFYLGKDMEALVWIPVSLTVYTQGKLLPKEKIIFQAQQWLSKQGRALAGELEFRKLEVPELVYFPQQGLHLNFSMQGRLRPGTNSFWLEIQSPDQRVLRRINASVFVDCWRTVPCAARPLNRGEALTPELVTFKRKNLAYLNGQVWDGHGGPWRLRNSVGTGRPVLLRNIELMPAVCKGQRMSLVYRGNTIRLQVPVVSLQEGDVGDVIRVRNLQSTRTVFAKVVDPQTVSIEAVN